MNHESKILKHALANKPELQRDLQVLMDSIALQNTASDDFRRSMGVLMNSERYIPQLLQTLSREPAADRLWLEKVRADAFQWLTQSDIPALQQAVKDNIEHAKAIGLTTLAQHLAIMLRYSTLAEESMQVAINCGIAENASDVLKTYDSLQHQAMQYQRYMQMVLLGLSLISLMYLLLLLFSRQRMAGTLMVANQRLEALEQQIIDDLSRQIKAEARYHTLLDVVPNGVGVHRQGRWLYLNPAAVKLFGASTEDELIGTPVLDRVHPEEQAEVVRRIQQQLGQGKAAPMMLERNMRLDGSFFYGEVQAIPFEDHDGEVSILVVVRDVSDRIAAEEESQRLSIAVAQADEGIFIADEEGKIIYANPAFARVAGIPHEQILGHYAAELRGGSVADEAYQDVLKSMNAGESWESEFTFTNGQGQQRTVVRKVSPVVDPFGAVKYHVAMDFDVTEARQMQARMEHAQRLESLGVLAGGIAHDFNNILMIIMGNASMASMRLKDQPEALSYLEPIEKASERAADLCRQMLAYSGKGRYILQAIDLSALVQDISQLLRVSLARGVDLQLHLAEHLPMIEGDASQIQQVVLNLVTNANEAMVDGTGQITLTTASTSLDDQQIQRMNHNLQAEPQPAAGEYVYFTVQDNGCGMDEATYKRVFEPFFSTKFTGRGLGMSAVQGIVRSHYGLIDLHSKVGEGSTLSIYLPVFASSLG
jgi:PAS domain S-box-containing protein